MSQLTAAQSNSERAGDDWRTPNWLFDQLDSLLGPFRLDAAASSTNTLVPSNYLTENDDALAMGWNAQTVWLNPPYSDVKPWVRKCVREIQRSGGPELICALLPGKFESWWWVGSVAPAAAEIWLIRGRISFVGPCKGSPSYGSAVVVYRRGHTGPARYMHWDPDRKWRRDATEPVRYPF